MAQHAEGTYTLLDVRQPREFAQSRIPGAKHIPVSELLDRLDELNPQFPTLVYCAIGGRSRTAAQLLSGQKFQEVYNIKGGLAAWKGHKTEFDPELGMQHMTGDESPQDIIRLAYGMEDGLGSLYHRLANRIADRQTSELLEKLAIIETSHRDKLFSLFETYTAKSAQENGFEIDGASPIMEGGMTVDDFLEVHEGVLKQPYAVVDMAMTIETQALDLYLRYSQKAEDVETREVLYGIAQDEKAHLAALGGLMDKLVPSEHLIDSEV